jgi:hypothetical protein
LSVENVANGLVDRVRQGDFMGAIEQYYADDIVSVESVATPEMPAELRGIEAVRGKNEWWGQNHDVHGFEVEGPFIGDDGFAVRYTFDVTQKGTGQRTKMSEMALYKVEGDKIKREEFYYNPGSNG